MVKSIYLFSFVETPRKFIIAKLSIRKLGSSSVLIIRLFEFTRPFYTLSVVIVCSRDNINLSAFDVIIKKGLLTKY